MIDLIKELAAAAARGVEVTIVTNGHNPPPLTLRWKHEEKWWGAISTYEGAGYRLVVIDRDGDDSEWELKRGKSVIAAGRNHDNHPYYHFDACLLAAEGALRVEVKRRIAKLRYKPKPVSKPAKHRKRRASKVENA